MIKNESINLHYYLCSQKYLNIVKIHIKQNNAQ